MSNDTNTEDDYLNICVSSVMKTPSGRHFVYWLLESYGVFRSSFVLGRPDASAFNEGMRNAGLMLYAKIQEQEPELYSMMLSEHKDKDS